MMTQSIFTKSYKSPTRHKRSVNKGSPLTNNYKKHDRIFNNSTTSFGVGDDTPMNILEINEENSIFDREASTP
jgi:hypothetical protein